MKKSLKWQIAQKAELRWWQNYLRKKSPDVYLDWKRSYWLNLIAKAGLEDLLNETKNILDAGCGPAGIFIVLDKHHIDAVDPLIDDYESLDHFKKSLYPYCAFFNSPIEQLNTPKDYDIVFCMNAINHVSDLKETLGILNRHTAVGGTLVLSIDAHNFSFFKNLFRLIPGDILHPHQYDLKEYKEMLEKEGFGIFNEVLLKKEFVFDHYLLIARK